MAASRLAGPSPLVSLGSDYGQRDVTRWRSRGKFCRSGVEERVKSRFFLAIDFTRPYSDFVFGCGKFFLPRNSDADERVAGEVR